MSLYNFCEMKLFMYKIIVQRYVYKPAMVSTLGLTENVYLVKHYYYYLNKLLLLP